ncbi:hypothetical protein ACLKMH_23450 [Psychromonas sp. KJ10-10]|uniref:hypothetical protein n=1 Tax=Psychromonas sp. KJ10-10 TaxID=3391823 RepID=UPI0039B578D8
MKTEQLIWFIDSRHFYLNISLDKIIHLANTHQKKLLLSLMQEGNQQALGIRIY